jgi:hypothetical protein
MKKRTLNGVQFRYQHPCGQCMGCRIRRREEWTGKILMEASVHESSVFGTLTYDEEPELGVNVKDVQKFVKKLRYHLTTPVRYYIVGEYGEHTDRAHYHCVLFGTNLMMEEEICRSWNHGFVKLSELTPARARYAARYTTKKLASDAQRPDGRAPEFSISSRKPPLGRIAFDTLADALKRQQQCLPDSRFLDKKTKQTMITSPGFYRVGRHTFPMTQYQRHKLTVKLGALKTNSLSKARWTDEEMSLYDSGDPVSQVVPRAEKRGKARLLELKAKRRAGYL